MEPLYRPFFTCPTEKQQYSQTLHTLESFFSPREVLFWWSFGLNHLCRVGLSYTMNSQAVVSWRRQVKKRRSVASVPGLCQLQRAWIYLKRARFPCLSPIWFFELISIFHCNFILLRLISPTILRRFKWSQQLKNPFTMSEISTRLIDTKMCYAQPLDFEVIK